MKTIRLIAREDMATGEVGLVVEAMKMIDTFMVAREGATIAHDLLEHQNGIESIGSIDDELEALGGVWFIRGQTGMIRRGGSMWSPEESLASDVCNLGEIYMRGVEFRTPIPKTRACDHDESFEEMIRIGMKSLRDELSYDEDEPIDYSRMNEYRDACIHYLRTGYRKAQRKYKDSYTAQRMFWNIADAVEPYVREVEYEGQEFMLSYDKTRAYCEEFYNEDYY